MHKHKSVKYSCPICLSKKLEKISESIVPVLQNRVFESIEEAMDSQRGNLELTFCHDCQFSFNSAFDAKLAIYDQSYDNSVPSLVFGKYYESIGHYLNQQYDLSTGLVYDIGCGKGTFLKMLTKQFSSVHALGIDPSYVGELKPNENLTFIQDIFKSEFVVNKPSLIICRHVFEHIEFPVEFLKSISNALDNFKDVPMFMEVPDFTWTIGNVAYWDLCYEHCNYFTPYSIQELLNKAGVQLKSIKSGFEGQYLWIEAIINPVELRKANIFPDIINVEELIGFSKSVAKFTNKLIEKLLDLQKSGRQISIWGMATKGVILTNILEKCMIHVNNCIDVNVEKQEKYIPCYGNIIQSPYALRFEGGEKHVIIVMNTNYLEEIKQSVNSFLDQIIFVDAHGNEI